MAAKKPSFVKAMTHNGDVVSQQVEVGLANIQHYYKFMEKLVACAPADPQKVLKGIKPAVDEADMMSQYAFVQTQADNLLLAYVSHEREWFLKLQEVVIKPLSEFYVANIRQKRALDLELAKFSKALKESKTILKKDEAEARGALEQYIKLHLPQVSLRNAFKDAPADTSMEKFLQGAELESFRKQQIMDKANAAAKASPQYDAYQKSRKKTFEAFNKYELQLQQARTDQLKFHGFLTEYLQQMESMERYRMKSIEVSLKKLTTLFEIHSKKMRETLDGLETMCMTVTNLDEQQLQHSLRVWEFMYGPCPPYEPLEYRLPCKCGDIMDDLRTNFETVPALPPKTPYVMPKGPPPTFVPESALKRPVHYISPLTNSDRALGASGAIGYELGPPEVALWNEPAYERNRSETRSV